MLNRFMFTAAATLLSLDATAQRTKDNAVARADDAFGSTIGNETTGLYSNSQVRGFSPVDAGNIRLEGLYFDRRSSLSPRLVEASSVRVGLSAQGYSFPAPTGIVDYRLRRAGEAPVISLVAALNTYGGPALEIDAELPITESIGLATGLSYSHEEYYDGADANYLRAAIIPRWQLSDNFSTTLFASLVRGRDEEVAPTIVTAGPWLPPTLARRQYFGQSWADNEIDLQDYGAIINARLNSQWALSAGLFHSINYKAKNFSDIYTETSRDGVARELLIADPAQDFTSTSGELHLTGDYSNEQSAHKLYAMLRGREQDNLYGGSAAPIDLGVRLLGTPSNAAKPDAFLFNPRTQSATDQWTAGLGYHGRRVSLGEINFGVQYSDYQKDILQPASAPTATADTDLLFNAALAAYLSHSLAIYTGHTRGIEESGIAPGSAANRNEALPAIHTQQTDAGLRWQINPALKMVLGGFEVNKPYFTTNAANIYSTSGEVKHRGVEISLSGKISSELALVAGAVFMDPVVNYRDSNNSPKHRRPVGQAARMIRTSLDYTPAEHPAISFDLNINHVGERVASNDELNKVAAYTQFDVGLRYRFSLRDADGIFRLRLINATNVLSWKINSHNSLGLTDERHVTAQLLIDLGK